MSEEAKNKDASGKTPNFSSQWAERISSVLAGFPSVAPDKKHEALLDLIVYAGVLLAEADVQILLMQGENKKAIAAQGAMICWFDMLSKIGELVKDPAMSSEKWKEWLPICEYTDERFYISFNLNKKSFLSLARIVERNISYP